MTEKKIIKLFVIWLILFALFTAAILFLSSMYVFEHHLEKRDLPGQYKLAISYILVLLFCPSLAIIHRCAQKANVKTIKTSSLSLLLFLLIASIGSVISALF